MATRKPDWAQRMVEKLHHNELVPRTMDNLRALYLSQAAALLRAHQRRVVKSVKHEKALHEKILNTLGKDKWQARLALETGIAACNDILAALKELEK